MTQPSEAIQLEAKVVAKAVHEAGLTQQDIANALNLSQSQVSRVLAGRLVRRSLAFDKICIYAYDIQARAQALGEGKPQANTSATLMNAINATWDGTEAHASALAIVIRSLGAFKPGVSCGPRNNEGEKTP